MATATTPPDESFVRTGVSWAEYIAFCDSLGERRVRVTYDRGAMEFMTVSQLRERIKHLFALLLAVLCEELDIDIAGFGNMTFRREDLERGLEPDECYWIANEALVRGRTDLDFTSDPPPDLVIEAEITRSVLDRMAIYAGLQVPEIWRCEQRSIRVCVLGADGRYVEVPRSPTFPFLPITELVRFVGLAATMSDTKLRQTFRTWVREQQAQGWPAGS